MDSIFFTVMVLIVNIFIIPVIVSEQVDKRSQHDLSPRHPGLDPSTPYLKANPHGSSPQTKTPRRRNTRRSGESCQQRPDASNPLRTPNDVANSLDDDYNLPIVRTPFVDSDERYCPMFQYVVCDSGVASDRVLRVGTGKWRLLNCNRVNLFSTCFDPHWIWCCQDYFSMGTGDLADFCDFQAKITLDMNDE